MSELLLDTHTLLWLATDDERLPDGVRAAALDAENLLWTSVATVWEMAIKKSLGKLELDVSLEKFLDRQRAALGFRLLPIHSQDALHVEALPWHHRDPFDRLLIAQAMHRKLTLMSADPNLAAYDVPIFWS